MVNQVEVPVMDQTTETVLLTRWLKQEGDAVHKGDALCEIETEKATVEIEANADGLLRKALIPAGTHIPPRTVVALIGSAGDSLPEIDPYYQTSKAKPSGPNTATAPAIQATSTSAPPATRAKEVRISPRARRLAEDHHVDISTITGSGPEGRIVEDDVKSIIERQAQAAVAGPTGAADRTARAKAERVSLSWRTIPHFYMAVTVDLTHVTARKLAAGAGITYTDMFALALSQLLPQHSTLNGHWQNDALVAIPEIRLGLVVQTERGLLIPALRDVRGRALDDIAAEREQVVQQAIAGTLTTTALVEPTFTLSNVGAGHIDAFTAIISPPQVAILSVGSVQQRPLVVNMEVASRPTATFTLGVDHRAIDGRQAAAFLEGLKEILESPG